MAFRQGHALLVGVGTYQHASEHNVEITVRDAEAVQQVLIDLNTCGYPEEQVTLISKEETTIEGVSSRLGELASRTNEEDTVFLYFCSHGAYGTDGVWYFTTHDTKFVPHNGSIRVDPGTGMGEKEIIEKIRAIPARKKFIIFNTCHSGEMGQSLSLNAPAPVVESRNPDQNLTYAILEEGKGNVIITAAGNDQLSYFGLADNTTIFTDALIDALKGNGVYNNNGYIGAFNLYTAVYETVQDEAKDRFRVDQQPELTVLKAVGSMPIALFRGSGSLSLTGFQPEEEPEGANVNSVSPRRANRAYQNQFGPGSTQYNIETIQGDFVGGDKIGGDKYEAGRDLNLDRSTTTTHHTDNRTQNIDRRTQNIQTDGGAFIGGTVNTGGGAFTGRDSLSIDNVGNNNTITQGSGNTVVGSRGVNIGGNNSGNVVTGSGNTVGGSGNTTTYTGGSDPIDIATAFTQIQQAMSQSTVAPAMKAVGETTLQGLKGEADKGDSAMEPVVESLMNTIITVLPDIAGVVLQTFLGPVTGLSTVFRTVAQKLSK